MKMQNEKCKMQNWGLAVCSQLRYEPPSEREVPSECEAEGACVISGNRSPYQGTKDFVARAPSVANATAPSRREPLLRPCNSSTIKI